MRRRRSLLFDIDWVTIAIYLALLSIGVYTIYAVEYVPGDSFSFDFGTSYGKQLVWIGVSLIVGLGLLIIDSKFYTVFSYPIYGLVLLLLLIVLFLGVTVSGSTSWIEIGGFRMQPAEFAKFGTALALAKYLSSLGGRRNHDKTRLVAFGIFMLPSLMIILQGDAGSGLVFSAFVLVLFREGLPYEFLVLGFLAVVLTILALVLNTVLLIGILILMAAVFIYFQREHRNQVLAILGILVFCCGLIVSVDYAFNEVLQPHQRDRINVLIGKEHDLKGSAYNLNQSKIAIGSGGIWGKGYLKGTQTQFNFVPEQSTDFIFSTIGEEHGLIGCSVLIGLYMFLMLRLIFLAERQRSRFSRIYGYGVASLLFFHMTVNVGMTIGLAPVIGIPFPFISYGGSAVLSFTILIFVFLKLDGDRLATLR